MIAMLWKCASLYLLSGLVLVGCASQPPAPKSEGDWRKPPSPDARPSAPPPPMSVPSVQRNRNIVQVHFGTNRMTTGHAEPERFFSDDDSQAKLNLGIARVSIPESHVEGKIEAPFSVLRVFSLQPNSERHFVFDGPLLTQTQADFVARLKASVGSSPVAQIAVYIHGLDNRFSEAIFRSAQIAFDLQRRGMPIVPVLFSWPTGAATTIPDKQQYLAAKDHTFGASANLKEFLELVHLAAPESRVHLVAHSMGAEVLAGALSNIGIEKLLITKGNSKYPRFNEIILAAPDIRKEDFATKILPAVKSHHRVTLYAASNDKAMVKSKEANHGARAGDTEPPLVNSRGVQVVDASKVNTGFVGHSYWAESTIVIDDLANVLRGKQPKERLLLQRQWHWVFP